MTLKARWSGVALWLAPLGAWPLGLGDIELRSALNQPLEADILLVSAAPDELEELRATLAAPETFERYGLDRPFFLAGFQFEVTRDHHRAFREDASRSDLVSRPIASRVYAAIGFAGFVANNPGHAPTTDGIKAGRSRRSGNLRAGVTR